MPLIGEDLIGRHGVVVYELCKKKRKSCRQGEETQVADEMRVEIGFGSEMI